MRDNELIGALRTKILALEGRIAELERPAAAICNLNEVFGGDDEPTNGREAAAEDDRRWAREAEDR